MRTNLEYPVSQPCLSDKERLLVNGALLNNELTYGYMARSFESQLAEYLRVKHVLVTSSGTTALHLVLAAMGIGPGDEVLVPDLTFVATANAVLYCGATPVLVDVHPKTWCMDPAEARRKITDRTAAIIPVHLYGNPCEMVSFLNMGVPIVEDAAEGFTGSYRGKMLGAIGEAGTFSFYGNKIMTTGEGGAVCTNNDDLAARMFLLRGQAIDPNRRYYHSEVGFNYRMTDIQAAIGLGQMTHLTSMVDRRRKIIHDYASRLGYHVCAPCVRPDIQHAPWLFTFQLNRGVNRENLMQRLIQRGIETRPTFVPLHRLPMFRGCDAEFPNACAVGDRGLSLPTYPQLTDGDVEHICDVVEHELRRSA